MSSNDLEQIQDAEIINPYNCIEIYKSGMEEAEAEYIEQYANGDPAELQNVDMFNGLIDYLHMRVFRADKRTRMFAKNTYNRLQRNALDYTDIDTLEYIFTAYKLLCSKYKKAYNRQQFCCLTGIAKQTFDSWLHGNTREASPRQMDFAKKVQADCESILAGKVINTNSIGSMFVLKCGYGWHEDQHLVIETANSRHDSAEQIAARHASAALPEKPSFEDE